MIRQTAYNVATCTAVLSIAAMLAGAGLIFIVSIPITWLVGELLMPRDTE